VSRCEACDAAIVWAKNDVTGRVAPVNRAVDPFGNVVLLAAQGQYHVLSAAALSYLRCEALFTEEPNELASLLIHTRHTLHFATCPKADHFRRCKKCRQSPCTCPTTKREP